MAEAVLFVDDDHHILDSYARQFRKFFRVETAMSGEEGLQRLREDGPFAVVVSDQKMPGLEGVQFLAQAREAAPDTVRIMLTGYADFMTAIEAVNEGAVFRFLTKPCPLEVMAKALAVAVRQYRLVRSEKELLEQTLRGSVEVLTEVLATINPEAYGRTSRIAHLAKEMAGVLKLEELWQVETAALLSQVGCIMLPEETTRKVSQGKRLTEEETELFNQHPGLGASFIKNIPRLEEVARMVEYQEKNFDGTGIPPDDVEGETIPLGARLLKVALDFDQLSSQPETTKGRVFNQMKDLAGQVYDPKVLQALETVLGVEAKYDVKDKSIYGLKPGMILAENIYTLRQRKLALAKGHPLTPSLISYLFKLNGSVGVTQPIKVIIPFEDQ